MLKENIKFKEISIAVIFRIAITIAVFAFFLYTMAHNLMFSPLWGDEWTEYEFSQYGLRNGSMYHAIISTYQPPLYNWIMHFWLKVSTNLVWFRSFNVVIGMITASFLFATLKRLYHTYVADAALVALAVTYEWIYCIQECSEYTLLLVFIAASFYFYVRVCENYSYVFLILFVLSCVGALYSQYGAAFVSVPFLMVAYIKFVTERHTKKDRIWLTVIYAISGLGFGIPLYKYFLIPQTAHQQTVEEGVPFAIDMLKDMHAWIGQLIAYFFHLQEDETWNQFFVYFGVIVLCASVIAIVNRKTQSVKRTILVVFILGYVLHVMLVQCNIYAKGAGFFFRYSYFYMPMLSIVIPIAIIELAGLFRPNVRAGIAMLLAGSMVPGLYYSYTVMMENWKKANDDTIAQIWLEKQAWNLPTYLAGYAEDAFYQWIPEYTDMNEEYLQNLYPVTQESDVDLEKLPDRFYIWQTNWPTAFGNKIIEHAIFLDYSYERYFYADEGYGGMLIYFEKVEQNGETAN